MKFSVVMPAFNEERHIARTLRALEAQTLPKTEFEVILVDNGSTDRTVAIAEGFFPLLNLRVVLKVGGSIASVRNYGSALAAGEVLAFLDSDCYPLPTWLEQSWQYRQENTLWGAHYLVPEDGTWVGKIWGEFQAKEQEGPTSFIPSSNLFIARADFENLGGFGNALETSEDVELSIRARSAGMQVLAFPSLAVFHEGTPRTLRHFFRQNRWHGKHVLRVFLANLPRITHLPLLMLSLYTVLMFAGTVIAAALIPFTHHWIVATVLFVLLVLPAALLSVGKTLPKGRIQAIPALFVLYMTYLLSRAASLLQPPVRSHR